jgi:hypothetical protein
VVAHHIAQAVPRASMLHVAIDVADEGGARRVSRVHVLSWMVLTCPDQRELHLSGLVDIHAEVFAPRSWHAGRGANGVDSRVGGDIERDRRASATIVWWGPYLPFWASLEGRLQLGVVWRRGGGRAAARLASLRLPASLQQSAVAA